MLRELTAFLSLFSLLSLILGLEGMVFIFGIGAILLLAADLLLPHFGGSAVREAQALPTRDRVSA
jgi:hypothetical protein